MRGELWDGVGRPSPCSDVPVRGDPASEESGLLWQQQAAAGPREVGGRPSWNAPAPGLASALGDSVTEHRLGFSMAAERNVVELASLPSLFPPSLFPPSFPPTVPPSFLHWRLIILGTGLDSQDSPCPHRVHGGMGGGLVMSLSGAGLAWVSGGVCVWGGVPGPPVRQFLCPPGTTRPSVCTRLGTSTRSSVLPHSRATIRAFPTLGLAR